MTTFDQAENAQLPIGPSGPCPGEVHAASVGPRDPEHVLPAGWMAVFGLRWRRPHGIRSQMDFMAVAGQGIIRWRRGWAARPSLGLADHQAGRSSFSCHALAGVRRPGIVSWLLRQGRRWSLARGRKCENWKQKMRMTGKKAAVAAQGFRTIGGDDLPRVFGTMDLDFGPSARRFLGWHRTEPLPWRGRHPAAVMAWWSSVAGDFPNGRARNPTGKWSRWRAECTSSNVRRMRSTPPRIFLLGVRFPAGTAGVTPSAAPLALKNRSGGGTPGTTVFRAASGVRARNRDLAAPTTSALW